MVGSIGRVGRMIGRTGQASPSRPWSYLDLGAKLREGVDAARTDTLTLESGGAVSAWRSVKSASLVGNQSVGAARPLWLPTGSNGKPVVWADGLDDELTFAGLGALQSGGAAGEWWGIIDQAAPASDAAVRYFASYGGSAQTNNRVCRRAVSAGANVLTANTGSGASGVISPAAPGDFSGRKIIRHVFGATATNCELNGAAGSPVTVTPATGSSIFRLFANTAASPGSFGHGGISLLLFTDILNPTEAAKMTAYLNARL